MASTTHDRFDDIPDDLVRVGAHRAPVKRGRGWINFAWAALATGVLIVGGLYGLSRVNPAISFEIPVLGGDAAEPGTTSTPEPEATPLTDPALVDPALNLTISVFNASPTDDQEDAAAAQITQANWPQPAAAVASERDQELTVIYYNGAQFESIALGLAQLLGTDPANIANSDAYLGAPVTIVLGADYVPPAA
ncbi:LytR C-terminal domain-containing protein [Pseudolysinimonas sp.]|uniref:LytR C-terminal domain-containing protein n=1 Tax=Pseudolysinimonas sp. TaxID=2680009 RepID=UPI00286B60C7|nr:LytR C-terminal domain-containing protein [Pseudolysinimonas sp.]